MNTQWRNRLMISTIVLGTVTGIAACSGSQSPLIQVTDNPVTSYLPAPVPSPVPMANTVNATCAINLTSTAPSGATVNAPTITITYTNNGTQLEDISTTHVITYDGNGSQIFNDGVVSAFTPGGMLDTGQTMTDTSDILDNTSATSCKVWFNTTP